ncbi:MAG TPA: MFS transporter [Ktedonobacterales bacterium]|nr:MFS transporter [Ktedonobacterales bacterium]
MTLETASADDATAGKPQRHANHWVVLLLVFTMAGVVESQAFGHLNAFRPLYLQQLGVPAPNIPTWTGVLAALGFVIGLPLLPFWGVWADRYSRKLIIVRSAYVEGIMFTVAALAPNVWVLAVAQLFSGFVLGNTGVMLAMLADVTPRKRLGMAVGIASAGFPIGSSIGPFFGGLIAQGPGIRALLGVDAGLSALMGLALTLIVREELHKSRTGETVGRMLRAAVYAIVSSPIVLRLFILYFLAMYGYSLASPFIPILLQKWYTGDPRELAGVIGLTLTLAGIAMAIMTPIWGRIGDTAGRWIVLPICLAGIIVGLSVAAFAHSLLPLQLDIIGMGLFQGGIGTTVIALLALLSPEERRAPILNFSLLPSQLSWFFGPITGAALSHVSLSLPFIAGACSVTAALAFACVLAVRARRGSVATAGRAAG